MSGNTVLPTIGEMSKEHRNVGEIVFLLSMYSQQPVALGNIWSDAAPQSLYLTGVQTVPHSAGCAAVYFRYDVFQNKSCYYQLRR